MRPARAARTGETGSSSDAPLRVSLLGEARHGDRLLVTVGQGLRRAAVELGRLELNEPLANARVRFLVDVLGRRSAFALVPRVGRVGDRRPLEQLGDVVDETL